jgi:hypothetical protein
VATAKSACRAGLAHVFGLPYRLGVAHQIDRPLTKGARLSFARKSSEAHFTCRISRHRFVRPPIDLDASSTDFYGRRTEVTDARRTTELFLVSKFAINIRSRSDRIKVRDSATIPALDSIHVERT